MKKGSKGKLITRSEIMTLLHQCWNCQHHHNHVEKIAHHEYKTDLILCDIKNEYKKRDSSANGCASFKSYPRAL